MEGEVVGGRRRQHEADHGRHRQDARRRAPARRAETMIDQLLEPDDGTDHEERQDERLVLSAEVVEDGVIAQEILGERGKRSDGSHGSRQRKEAEGSEQSSEIERPIGREQPADHA